MYGIVVDREILDWKYCLVRSEQVSLNADNFLNVNLVLFAICVLNQLVEAIGQFGAVEVFVEIDLFRVE